MSTLTMGLAEAKNNFSRVTAEVNRTGKPVTILKNNRPWVVIQPAQQSESAVDVAVDFMDATRTCLKSSQSERLRVFSGRCMSHPFGCDYSLRWS